MKYAAIALAALLFGAVAFATVFPAQGGITLKNPTAPPLPMFKPSDECDWRPQVRTSLWKERQKGVEVPADLWQKLEEQMTSLESRCLMVWDCGQQRGKACTNSSK